ncbi:MAG: alpha/beta hydrolase [Candidatus Dormibacteraeota bacterium]|nr:alpha/beta hydrolase [Candidatus Dormibacteraeota bacterium]
MSKQPTIVLVHGAFADASSWNGVVELLLNDGHDVVAPPNPLRGIAIDSAYIASVLSQIDGPVLLVGHSYGGAVNSNAATKAANVVGLVFVAAFAPDEGETLGDVEGASRDSVLASAQLIRTYPAGSNGETAPEVLVDPAQFHTAFAADVPAGQAAVMAVTQRPVAAAAFTEKNGPPAWKNLPCWTVVATGDKAAGTDVIRAQALRAKSTITEVEGSHVIMVSQPQAVTDVILQALGAVSKQPIGTQG